MAVLISGSIAFDTVFEHAGRFSDAILPDAIPSLNLTFQAQAMRRSIGGCAGNIAYALRQLGGTPLIWTAVGGDAAPLLEHLKRHDIDTSEIVVIQETYSAQAVITTDANGCQLTTFFSGAMQYADRIAFPKERTIELAILAPTTEKPLLAHAKALRSRAIPYLLDTGQTTPLFSGEQLLMLAEHAAGVCYSDYEQELYREKTGLDAAALSARTGAVFCTHGAEGSTVWIAGEPHPVHAVPTMAVDPVGAGDAYRGGLLFALARGLNPLIAARVGSLIAAQKVAAAGPTYRYSLEAMLHDYQCVYKEAPPETLTQEPRSN